MKNIRVYLMTLLVLLTMTLSSCDVVGGIFKAGAYTAIIVVVLAAVLIFWLFRKFRGPRGPRV